MPIIFTARSPRPAALCARLSAWAGMMAVIVNLLLPLSLAATPPAGAAAFAICTPHGIEFRVLPGTLPDEGGGVPACPLCPGPLAQATIDPTAVLETVAVRYPGTAAAVPDDLFVPPPRFAGLHPVRAPPLLTV